MIDVASAQSIPPVELAYEVETVQGVDFVGCSADAKRNLLETVGFMKTNMETLKNDTNLHRREGRERSIRRRMDRKVDRLTIDCREAVLCRDSSPRDGLHAFGIMTNRLRICYDKLAQRNASFCSLTKLVVHEFGHAVGIAKDRVGQHHADKKDRVYQFGWFARDLCEWWGLERSLSAPSRTPTAPPAPTDGISLFPHKNYVGWERNFDSDVNNLRDSGQQDTTSSIRVLSGRWVVCSDSGEQGRCEVITGNVPDTHAIGLGDNISSIAEIPSLSEGIVFYDRRGFTGDAEGLIAGESYRDLSVIDFEDIIQSVQIAPGERWELCVNDDFERCVTLVQDEARLNGYGLHRNISSIRPSTANPDVGATLFDKRDHVSPRFDIDYLVYQQAFKEHETEILMSNRIPDLSVYGFNNKAESIQVRRGVWQFCDKTRWRGNCILARANILNLGDLNFNNKITSVERLIPNNRDIVLVVYKEVAGGGASYRMTLQNPSIPDLNSTGLEDQIRSLGILGGWWQTCEDDNFRGKCKIWQSSVRDLNEFGYDGLISSIRLIAYQ